MWVWVRKGEFLGFFLFLKKNHKYEIWFGNSQVWPKDIEAYIYIYICNFNEVLRFGNYAQNGPVRWYCAGRWTSAVHTSRVARRAHANRTHLATFAPRQATRQQHSALVHQCTTNAKRNFTIALVLHWCANGRTTSALGTPLSSHAQLQGKKGKCNNAS